MITNHEADVLLHIASNGRYVTNEADVIAMGKRGLLFDHGPQVLAGGAHYLVTTPAGRSALSEWKIAQPKPPKLKRRRPSEAFEAWRTFCDVFNRIPFSQFWKEVWPNRKAHLGL